MSQPAPVNDNDDWRGLPIADLWRLRFTSAPQYRPASRARKLTMWFAARCLKMTFTDIAKVAGLSKDRVAWIVRGADRELARRANIPPPDTGWGLAWVHPALHECYRRPQRARRTR